MKRVGAWLGKRSIGVLEGVVAGIVLLVVAGGAITISIVNNNSNSVSSDSSKTDSSAPSAGAADEMSRSEPGAPPPPRFDPSETGTVAVSSSSSRHFLGRKFYVAIGDLTEPTGQTGPYRASSITLQEGDLPACTFTNTGGGRFWYRRSEREYEVTVDIRNQFSADVNVAEWTGRRTKADPCFGEETAG